MADDTEVMSDETEGVERMIGKTDGGLGHRFSYLIFRSSPCTSISRTTLAQTSLSNLLFCLFCPNCIGPLVFGHICCSPLASLDCLCPSMPLQVPCTHLYPTIPAPPALLTRKVDDRNHELPTRELHLRLSRESKSSLLR